ncbi:DUF1858 domain-containing protein [Candidatus Woesearchaeota archaeon]|jgi:hybrid cluster-associated redox disulfide protein|nr:DUF1858 domain-containing protein [Candidatus Woesearchaeota archaeon]MBT6519835.1 DUF1858 domain-containing protein [Candidatus Woesearchaeota archaeon]MBT7366892.1 DUF1858 domain-containing protein [Candidatus Woesearchaeota archaeon]
MTSTFLIDKQMLIADLVKKYPASIEILTDNGIVFIGNHIAMNETIEQGANYHKINPNKIIKEINELIRGEI